MESCEHRLDDIACLAADEPALQKCQLCKEKMGTKVQCTKSDKCVRACHVTCGLRVDSGYFVDAQLGSGNNTFSLLDPNGDTTIPAGIDPNGLLNLVILCRQHNPAWLQAEKERKNNELSDRITAIPLGSQIKVRMPAGVFAVFVIAHNPVRRSVSVQFENGQRTEMPHAKVVFENAAATARSAEAKEDPYIWGAFPRSPLL